MARTWAALLVVVAAAAAAAAAAEPRRVVIIGLDGLGGDWLLQANAPRLKALIANGTSTLVMQARLSPYPTT
jgi:hypothetical protein